MMKLIDEMVAAGPCAGQQRAWRPAVDVYRTTTGWLVKFDLAGVSPKELELRRKGPRLTVIGSRRDSMVHQGLSSYSMEISYNRFERSIELPTEIEESEIETEYRDGMLLVWLSQTERQR